MGQVKLGRRRLGTAGPSLDELTITLNRVTELPGRFRGAGCFEHFCRIIPWRVREDVIGDKDPFTQKHKKEQ